MQAVDLCWTRELAALLYVHSQELQSICAAVSSVQHLQSCVPDCPKAMLSHLELAVTLMEPYAVASKDLDHSPAGEIPELRLVVYQHQSHGTTPEGGRMMHIYSWKAWCAH